MNKPVLEFMRSEILDKLESCTEPQKLLFKRMYSHKNLERPLSEIVQAIPEDNLELAMNQVFRTLSIPV